MRSVALSEAKDKLSALIDEAEHEHEIIHITRHGRQAAVLMSVDDLESLQETLFWLSQPGIHEDLAVSQREIQAGNTLSLDEVRERLARAHGD